MPLEVMAKGISGLKREIKRAKLFEVQRLVRRLRQLANKKGTGAQIKKNQRKVERFEKELEFLKDAQVDEIARRIKKEDEDDGPENNQVLDERVEGSHVDIDLHKRALDRIVNSTKIKEFLKKVDASNEDSAHAEKRSSDVEAPRLKKQHKVAKEKLKTKRSDNRTCKEPEDLGSGNVYEEIPMLKKQHKSAKLKLEATCTMASTGEPQLQIQNVDDEDDISSDEEIPRLKKKQKAMRNKVYMSESRTSETLVNEVDEGDGFLPSSDFSGSDFEEDSDGIPSPELKPKGLDSCFVETMSGLRKEKGLRARNKQGNGKGKRNRKGQRARQQMWEKVHGKCAKHLKKSKTEITSNENKEARKQTSRVKVQHSFKRKNDDETLHPSWEAMKKKRAQETLKVEFKGQKIKFDDSE